MIEIRKGADRLDMPEGFSMAVEDTNPLMNERGSQSLPATVPATPDNLRLCGFPGRPDAVMPPMGEDTQCTVADGIYIRTGKINVTEASSDGVTFNVGFDNSTAYQEWAERKLSDLSNLPVFGPDSDTQEDLMEMLFQIYREADPQVSPLAIFPIALGCESVEEVVSDSAKRTLNYWEMLNIPTDHGLEPPNKITRVLNGTVTEVSVPNYYGVSPFVRVWKLLELIFADLGCSISSNPFREDVELSRLVVLNNAADVCCRGAVKYAELMPDVTVSEFMNALFVRFGLVYNINPDTRVAVLDFVRDIIRKRPVLDLSPLAGKDSKIIYEAPQYVSLSAGTSLDGASVAADRFEDYIKGFDMKELIIGLDADSWEWDRGRGSWNLHNGITPTTPAAPSQGSGVQLSDAGRLAVELPTMNWYKLDSYNQVKTESSSSCFPWNPEPEGVTAYELTSDDEFVALKFVDMAKGTLEHGLFSGYVPFYAAGSRHYHSYVKNSDGEKEDESGCATPLAFAFAITGSELDKEGTVGRVAPCSELATGKELGRCIAFPDGSAHTLSLLFQFKGGLFDRFWSGYDEILRHNCRKIELTARLKKHEVLTLDMFTPVLFRGIPCLIDKLSYSLPALDELAVDVSLIPISTQGVYDIAAEQGIHDIFGNVAQG